LVLIAQWIARAHHADELVNRRMQQRLGPVEQGDARNGAFGLRLVEDGFQKGPGHHPVVKDARVVFPIADGASGAAQIAVAENVDVEAEPRGRG